MPKIEFSSETPPDELLLCIILEGERPTYWLGYPRKIGEDDIIGWIRLPRLEQKLDDH